MKCSAIILPLKKRKFPLSVEVCLVLSESLDNAFQILSFIQLICQPMKVLSWHKRNSSDVLFQASCLEIIVGSIVISSFSELLCLLEIFFFEFRVIIFNKIH